MRKFEHRHVTHDENSELPGSRNSNFKLPIFGEFNGRIDWKYWRWATGWWKRWTGAFATHSRTNVEAWDDKVQIVETTKTKDTRKRKYHETQVTLFFRTVPKQSTTDNTCDQISSSAPTVASTEVQVSKKSKWIDPYVERDKTTQEGCRKNLQCSTKIERG